MKKFKLLISILLLVQTSAFSQEKFPFSIDLINTNGDTLNSSDLVLDERYVFLDFWNAGCKPCISQLNALSNQFKQVEDKGIRVIAISTFPPDVASKKIVSKYQWPFEVYYDFTGKLFRKYSKLNVSVPFSIIMDDKGKVVHQQRGTKVKYKEEDGTLIIDKDKILNALRNGEIEKVVSSLDDYFLVVENDRLKKQ